MKKAQHLIIDDFLLFFFFDYSYQIYILKLCMMLLSLSLEMKYYQEEHLINANFIAGRCSKIGISIDEINYP